VGFVKRIATANAAPTPSSINFSVAATSGTGSLLVAVGFGNQAGTVSSITDTAGNSYALDFAANVTTTSGRGLEIWRCPSLISLTTSDSITVTLSATQDHGVSVIVDQFTFLGTPDVTNFSFNSSSTTSNSVSLTATSSDILVYSALASNGMSSSFSAGGSFTTSGSSINDGSNPTITLACAYDASPSAGTVTASWSWTTAHSNVADIVAYPVGSAGAPGKAGVQPRRRVVRYRPRARLGGAGFVSAGLGVQSFPLIGPTIPVTVTAVAGTPTGAAMIVAQTSGTSTFDYGLSTISLSNTAGNTLVLFAGWDLSTQPTSAAMAAAYVTDSAGNYWYHAGTSAATVTGSRCVIWVCPNARPVTWLSVSATTFVSSLAYLVAEVANMPAYFSVDVAATVSDASNTTLTVTPGLTSGVDFAFAVLATGATGLSPATPAGWSALNTVTAGAGAANPVEIFPYWQATAAGTDLDITWTTANAAPLSGVVVGIKAVATPPPQNNPNFPVVKTEAGFGFDPGDPSQPPLADGSPIGLSWTDISARVIGTDGDAFITSMMGRQYELTQAEAGELHIGIQNWDGAFTPGNTASPYFPNVVAGTPVRVSAFWAGAWYHIGFGYVEQWPQAWPDLPQFGISQMVATDAIAVMASATMVSALDGDMLLDAPYVFIPCNEQYTSFQGGINPTFTSADAQGLVAANTSRVNQRAAAYVDGVPASGTTYQAATGQTTNMLGDSDSGFGTAGVSTAPVVSQSGPGVVYTDPAMPDPVTGNGVSVEFWLIVPTAAAAALEPVVFSAYGPASNYGPYTPSLQVKIHSFSGATASVILADGTTVTVPFNPSPAAQQIVLTLTAGGLQVYVNGGLAATATLTAAQTSEWNAVTLGSANYGYGTARISVGNFTAFDLALFPYILPVQRILSHYVTGFSGQQNVDATVRVAQILSWANLGFPRAGQVTFGTPATSVGLMEGPAYDVGGKNASDAVNQVAVNETGAIAAAPSGALVFIHKWALFNQAPVVTFGDSPAPAPTEVPYLQPTSWGYDTTYVYNVVQTTQTSGPNTTIIATAADFNSQQDYFLRSALQVAIETTSDLDVYDNANWSIAKYAQPQLRVSGMEIDAASNPAAAFPAILPLQQAQVVNVIRRPVGGAVVSGTVLVQKIQHEIGPAMWKTSIQLSPYAPEDAVLQLDAAGFDVLGNNTLA
jgi:hypothetical protein